MAGFEDLIRGALQKQGDPTPERRAAIYTSSRQALDRMLAQSSTLDENAMQIQRNRLEAAIEQIESDFRAAQPQVRAASAAPPPGERPAAPVAPQPAAKPAPPTAQPPVRPPVASPATPAVAPPVAPQPPARPAGSVAPAQTRREPGFDAPPAPRPAQGFAQSSASAPAMQPAPRQAPPVAAKPQAILQPSRLEPEMGSDAHIGYSDELPQVYRGDALRERKPYAKFLLWAIILAGIGMSIWWAVNFGPDMIKQKLGGSVPNPQETIESGSFIPPAGEGWVTAFEPSENSGNIDASGRGTAELFQDGERTFVRLASNQGSSNNAVRIKLPRGVILPLQGKAATFELVLKNATDTPHQFALFCEFAAMGNCGRKRFKAEQQVEAFIFDVLVNDVILPENEDAYISFNTDLGSTGKALDLYTIRVRAGS